MIPEYDRQSFDEIVNRHYQLIPLANQTVASNTIHNFGNYIAALGLGTASNYVSGKLFNSDSELGRSFGTLFSSTSSAALGKMSSNLMKKQFLTEGLSTDVGASIGGAAAGLTGNYIGQGINSLGGNTMLSRGIGQGIATGTGTIGGQALSNLIKYGTLAGKATDGSKLALIGKGAGSINPYALGMTVLGSALGSAFGPSKEYGGKYGNVTRTMDTIYDVTSAAANAIPVAGLFISAGMVLNKGLSNVFGSTDGMTKNDAILGSAFMPAPIKWINTLSGHTTDSFKGLNEYTINRTNNFMGNAFGNLGDKFQLAREESNKRYGGGIFGLFNSDDAYEDALKNIEFSNNAFQKVLALADLGERLDIRSLNMSSINNMRYLQSIQGGWSPISIGKQGMKIFNNATNHNMGMRLLSAAALIDNKQMILCSAID